MDKPSERKAGQGAPLRGRAKLRDSDKLQLALNAGRMGVWTFHVAETRIETSVLGREIFGLTPDEELSPALLVSRIHPDDLEHRNAAMADALLGENLDVEYRLFAKDGSIRWVMLRGQAEFDARGKLLRLHGVSLDITERKINEERLRLLLDELNHRVKNTLATVQSIAVQTRRNSDTPEQFSKALVSRVDAMARAHDLLTDKVWDGALLDEVVRLTLQAHTLHGGQRVTINGPPIRLSPNAAVTLNMAFHELATNAAKYGALSTDQGQVDVTWRLDNSNSESSPAIVDIRWIERNGPPVSAPATRGFGSRLIEQSLARELPGEVILEFAASGLVCSMRLLVSPKIGPVDAAKAPAS